MLGIHHLAAVSGSLFLNPLLQQLAEHKLQLQRRALEEEDQLARRRDDDNRRKALEDERVKAALRLKTGGSTFAALC